MGILNQKSKLELTTKLSTEASVNPPFHKRERIRDHKMNQIPVHDTEGFSENDTDDHSEESETDESERDEIKARFDKRLNILKRACSVLPQLRGANDLASHNQLIRLGFKSFNFKASRSSSDQVFEDEDIEVRQGLLRTVC